MRTVVIGGGAAGLIAAWRAASTGQSVTLIEKTSRLGTKILISGGGKCNVTHSGSVEDILRAFRPNEARFLRPSLYKFTNQNLLEMLTSRGLQVYTRDDGRIFPVDQTAKDVVQILASLVRQAGVRVRLESPVTAVHHDRVANGLEEVPADRVVVCVGGKSYPGTGTTGDGYAWLRDLGHTVVPVRPSLAPIYLESPWADLSGLSLRDCVLRARVSKEIARWRGDLLFTHHGVSGPCALGISREVAETTNKVVLETDIAPDMTSETLGADILSFVASNPRRPIASWIERLAPTRLVPRVLTASDLTPTSIGATLDKKARNRLVATMKALPLGQVRSVPLEKGEVVAGGISLDEVNPQTMESRIVPNLFLCGEILDIAGPVGGYNLQAAFSTGFVAGTA